MLKDLTEALKAPQDLEQTFATLRAIEEVAQSDPEAFGLGGDMGFEGSLSAVLIAKMKFYILVLTAQQLLIRELRKEEGTGVPVLH